MIFDTHCHLNDEQILSDIDNVLKRAKENNITKILVPGWDYKSSLKAIELANKFDDVYAAVGIHPTDVYDMTDSDYENFEKLLGNPKIVAIGEIGLDYHWCNDQCQRELQKKWFIKQIELANKHNLPVIIHNRDAFDDCLQILKGHKIYNSGVMHCYSGSAEYLKEIINLNLYVGLDGPVTYKNSKTPKEIAQIVPIDKLLIETDSPYLTPHPFRGKLNEPSYVRLVLNEIANLRSMDINDLEQILYINSCRLFGIKNEKSN